MLAAHLGGPAAKIPQRLAKKKLNGRRKGRGESSEGQEISLIIKGIRKGRGRVGQMRKNILRSPKISDGSAEKYWEGKK